MPSNQQQIIEQAKFTYSPSEKAFEKETKAIKDQGEKQVKAIQDKRSIKSIKKYPYSINDSPLILKQKEIFNELADERIEKITVLNNKVDTDNLIYKHTGPTIADAKFDKFDNALNLSNKIKDGKISLDDAKNNQTRLRPNLGELKKIRKKI